MDDVDEDLTQLAIRHALERHDYHFETVDRDDAIHAERLVRLMAATGTRLSRPRSP